VTGESPEEIKQPEGRETSENNKNNENKEKNNNGKALVRKKMSLGNWV